jgi:ribose transport system substrate-binding protein
MTERASRLLKILYVEDEHSNMDLMREVLKLRPTIRFLEAESGSAAMIIAESERPDLILLDRNLPDMNGEEVMRMLRGRVGTKDTPILIISGDAARPNVAETRLGVVGYLAKPYDVSELLSRIDSILSASTQ